MAGLCAPLSTLRQYPRGYLRMTRGRCGSLLLHRDGLAPSTPCRSPGALSFTPESGLTSDVTPCAKSATGSTGRCWRQAREDELGWLVLTVVRRPAVSFGAGAAHQHGPLAVAQAAGLEEGLDGLSVVDDGEGAGR